jgi:hypothetical protein
VRGGARKRPFSTSGRARPVSGSSWRLGGSRAHPAAPSTRWETILGIAGNAAHREPWNKGNIVGQKAPFKLKDIWAPRVRLPMEGRVRELALFNLGIDSKLRGCDLVALRVRDVCHGDQVATRAIVMQHKTRRPVQFENTRATRDTLQAWIKQAALKAETFSSPAGCTTHLIWAPGSTPASLGIGSMSWGWTVPTTAPTRCAGPRRH